MIRILTRGLIGISLVVATGLCQYVEDSIDCGGAGVGSLCYNQRAGVIYGASEYGPFFAISADSNRTVSSTLFDYPVWVVYDSIDNKAYCIVTTEAYDTIMVMDGWTHQRIGAIPLEWGTRAVWNPDNDRLYVSMDEENRVAVIDCHTNAVLCEIPVGESPVGLVLNRPHQKLYVQNTNSDNVSIIDLNTNQVIRTIAVGNSPEAACYSNVADKYYCGRYQSIIVVDGGSDSVLSQVPVADAPAAMVECPAHGLVMVAVGDSVLAVSTSADSVVSRLQVGQHPWAVVWSASTDQVYTVNYSNDVAVLAGDGSRVRCVVPVGLHPFALALAPGYGRLYVGHVGSRFVYVIRDTASGIQEEGSFGPPAALLRARPNPFTRSVAIVWNSTARGGDVARVYARDGRSVREARIPAGETRWVWDGRDGSGADVPAGVYTVIRAVGGRTLTATLVKAR
jgi:YVTN family beta-propeller protein